MGEIVLTSIQQFISMIPTCVLIVIVFNYIGSFVFNKR